MAPVKFDSARVRLICTRKVQVDFYNFEFQQIYHINFDDNLLRRLQKRVSRSHVLTLFFMLFCLFAYMQIKKKNNMSLSHPPISLCPYVPFRPPWTILFGIWRNGFLCSWHPQFQFIHKYFLFASHKHHSFYRSRSQFHSGPRFPIPFPTNLVKILFFFLLKAASLKQTSQIVIYRCFTGSVFILWDK